jgi:sugar lactone lactonase YvrE
MLNLIARYERFIKSFQVSLYEQEGEMLRFKAQLTFTNDSKLFIKEYVFENKERKYAYHWADISGNLICRWDNANHWTGISTSPHHKHTGNEVSESTETSVGDVLNIISEKLESKLKS